MTHPPAAGPAWVLHEPHAAPSTRQAHAVLSPADKPTPPSAKSPARKGFVPWGLVRGCLAIAVFTLLLWWLLVPLAFPVTSRAVVNARTAQIRSPIDGMNVELAGEAGDEVVEGQPLLRVANPLVDASHLSELKGRVRGLEAQRARVLCESREAAAAAPALRDTVKRYQQAVLASLESSVQEAKARVSATRIGMEAARSRHVRLARLAKSRVAVDAEVDDVQEAIAKASKDLDKEQAALDRLSNELAAAKKGVFLQHEASYARKRADEADEKIAATTNALKELEAKLASARVQLATEEKRIAGLKDVEVASPVAGTIWRRLGNPGQIVKKNEVVFEVADQGTVFVEALFHQRSLGSVSPGARATVKLTSGQRLAGTVRAVRTLGEGDAEAAYAIRLNSSDMKQVRVLIALDPDCRDASLIGRHVRVLITGQNPTWLEQSVAWLFGRVGV